MSLKRTRRPVLARPAEDPDSGAGWGTTLAGGAALLTAGVLARNPKLIGQAGKAFMGARYTGMLSGLAVPKSVAGNVGAPFISAMEQGSMAPIKAFFSPKTVKDYGKALWEGKTVGPVAGAAEETAGQTASRWNPFGRMIGAGDTATRGALERGGNSVKEAERLLLQTPLDPGMAKALDNPIARVFVPFRRTPGNFWKEGMHSLAPAGKFLKREKMSPEEYRKLITLGVTSGAGAATGVATEDGETFQQAIPLGLGTAAAGTYGLPFALGAAAGRHFLGSGKKASVSRALQGTVPFSEYGLASTITDPLRAMNPSTSPMANTLRRLKREQWGSNK